METAEEIVAKINKEAGSLANAHPSISFRALCRWILLILKGKKIKRIELFPPYRIILEEEAT